MNNKYNKKNSSKIKNAEKNNYDKPNEKKVSNNKERDIFYSTIKIIVNSLIDDL